MFAPVAAWVSGPYWVGCTVVGVPPIVGIEIGQVGAKLTHGATASMLPSAEL